MIIHAKTGFSMQTFVIFISNRRYRLPSSRLPVLSLFLRGSHDGRRDLPGLPNILEVATGNR
jgi:hypothetical protein